MLYMKIDGEIKKIQQGVVFPGTPFPVCFLVSYSQLEAFERVWKSEREMEAKVL